MTSHTIATIHPEHRGANDVDELQLRRDDSGPYLWQHTARGPVILRGKKALDELAAHLSRLGYGARQQTLVEQETR
jgi:hypothetical protein